MSVSLPQGVHLLALGVAQVEGEQRRPEQQNADRADRNVGVVGGLLLVGQLPGLGLVALDLGLDLLAGEAAVIGFGG